MLKLMTMDGLSSALMPPRFEFVFLVIGLKVVEDLWRKREVSVGLLRGLRPWKVGADKRVEAIFLRDNVLEMDGLQIVCVCVCVCWLGVYVDIGGFGFGISNI